jgi:hypothetical protein
MYLTDPGLPALTDPVLGWASSRKERSCTGYSQGPSWLYRKKPHVSLNVKGMAFPCLNSTSPFVSVNNTNSLHNLQELFLYYHFLPFPNFSPSWNDLFTAYCIKFISGLIFKVFQNLTPLFLAIVQPLHCIVHSCIA